MSNMSTLVIAAVLVAGVGVSAGAQGAVRRTLPPALCSFVSETEAESILGKRLGAPKTQPNGDCWYMREGGSDFGDVELILSVLRVRISSEKEFDNFVEQQVQRVNERLKKKGVGGMMQFTVSKADGVGAPAYFVDPGLYVFKKNTVLVVGLGGAKGVAIARTALRRMP